MSQRGNRQPMPNGVAGRLTMLAGVLWLTGGVAVVLGVAAGLAADGRPLRVLGVSVAGLVVGTVLLLLRHRQLPTAGYGGIVLLGSVAVGLVVWWAGPGGAAVAGVLYVYMTVFSFVWRRPVAVPLVVVSAALHLGALHLSQADALLASWLLVWSVAVVAGAVTGTIVALQRKLAVEQERLVGQLREADASKTALLYTIVHELARPMTGVVGFAETLLARRDELTGDERDVLIERLAASSRRLDRMLSAMLSLGRLSQGVVVPEPTATHLDAVVVQAIELAEVAPSVVTVQGDTHVAVVVDATHVAQALANLIDNAVKHGEGPVGIEVVRDQDAVRVCVTDRGPGVADEAKERVFEPFERARFEDASGGSGLGLALVREVAHLHGGAAWLEDRPGGGTRACLLLPLAANGTAVDD